MCFRIWVYTSTHVSTSKHINLYYFTYIFVSVYVCRYAHAPSLNSLFNFIRNFRCRKKLSGANNLKPQGNLCWPNAFLKYFFFYFSYFILILLFPFCNFISFHFWRGINLICSAQGQTAYMVYTYVSTNVGMSEHILVYKYIFIKLIMRVSGSFVYTIFSFSSVHLSPHAVKSGN